MQVQMQGVGGGYRGGGPDPRDPEYQCCCGSCEAKSGTRLLCMIELVLLFLQFAEIVVIQAWAGSQFTVQFCVGLFCVVAWFGVIASCLWGLSINSEAALIPHIVASSLTIVIIFVVEIMLLVMVASEGQALAMLVGAEGNQNALDRVRAYVMALGLVLMVVYAACFVLQCWATCIVYAAYKFIRDGNDSMAGGGGYGGGPIAYAPSKQPGPPVY